MKDGWREEEEMKGGERKGRSEKDVGESERRMQGEAEDLNLIGEQSKVKRGSQVAVDARKGKKRNGRTQKKGRVKRNRTTKSMRRGYF